MRGHVFIHLNYLVLRGLHNHYSESEIATAFYTEIREKLLRTVQL